MRSSYGHGVKCVCVKTSLAKEANNKRKKIRDGLHRPDSFPRLLSEIKVYGRRFRTGRSSSELLLSVLSVLSPLLFGSFLSSELAVVSLPSS
jgi:hypothetical protein